MQFVGWVRLAKLTHRFAHVIACRVVVKRRGGLRFANPPYGRAVSGRWKFPLDPMPNRKIGRANYGRQRLTGAATEEGR